MKALRISFDLAVFAMILWCVCELAWRAMV